MLLWISDRLAWTPHNNNNNNNNNSEHTVGTLPEYSVALGKQKGSTTETVGFHGD
jgi:hypothetical protein